ncbi:MAG: hypothetical protein JWR79_60 [Tardiphaga sp.]|jgi:hypothetical protein|nr:hypothetical protein [Tardiphaga sp.]
MPVYYFNLLIDDVLCADADGKNLPDDAAAVAEARASARELVAEAVRFDVPVPASHLLINDADGVELLILNLDIAPLLRQLSEPSRPRIAPRSEERPLGQK